MADAAKLIDDMAGWVNARINARATLAKTTVAKVVDGDYTGDDFTADVSAAWGLLAEDLTSFLAILPGSGDGGGSGPDDA